MSADYYYDDPERIDGPKSSSEFKKLLASLIFLVCGGLLIQTTLAANISLNPGAGV